MNLLKVCADRGQDLQYLIRMRQLTATTNSNSTPWLEPSSPHRPHTPKAFEDCSPLRSQSSELKVKPHFQMGLLLQMVRNEKRCISVHKLGVKSPLNKTSSNGYSSCKMVPSVSHQSSTRTNFSLHTAQIVHSNEIQDTQFYKQWFQIHPLGEARPNILERFNGPKRKVKLNVGCLYDRQKPRPR